jgi:CheY-like chemotaxis protein
VSESKPQDAGPDPTTVTAAGEPGPTVRTPASAIDILVVDDSPELLEWMRLDLEGRGYRVETALSGEECLGWVEQASPPCVLLDVMMPGEPKLTELLESHTTLRGESTILLDDSVYVGSERAHKPLYEILSSLGPNPELRLRRDETHRLMVYQRAEELYRVVADGQFQRQYGAVRIHLDGYTTCQLITSCPQFKGVHVILFTAGGPGTRNERVQRAFQVGASDYVLKSEYYTHLFDRIEQYVPGGPRVGRAEMEPGR